MGIHGPVALLSGPALFLGWGLRHLPVLDMHCQPLWSVLSPSAQLIRAPCGLSLKERKATRLPQVAPSASPGPAPISASLANSPRPGGLALSRGCQAPGLGGRCLPVTPMRAGPVQTPSPAVLPLALGQGPLLDVSTAPPAQAPMMPCSVSS